MRSCLAVLTIACVAFLAADATALAQIAHHPFAVGAGEGAVGHQNAIGSWLLGEESGFYLQLTHAVRATKASTGAALGLVALSFGYGVFHAAGPGHGKAVITSYMVSNEVALRRGLVIALLAAILQGVVATALVGIAAFLFDATAPTMTAASQAIELTSYLGIVALGLLLVWRKGRALWSTIRSRAPLLPESTPFALAAAGPPPRWRTSAGFGPGFGPSFGPGLALRQNSRFSAEECTIAQAHGGVFGADCQCGHSHMPDPALFGASRFDWKAAAIAVLTAGARPCSGAILVLVFALAQGIFLAGVAATFAMSLGTALTTGALATAAVFAKDMALRASGAGSARAAVVGRWVEFVAAAGVLLFGVTLLAAALSGVHGGA